MGLRLPIHSIPWVAENEYPWTWQQDPSQQLAALPKEFPYGPGNDLTRQHFVRGSSAPSASGYGPGQQAQTLDDSHDCGLRRLLDLALHQLVVNDPMDGASLFIVGDKNPKAVFLPQAAPIKFLLHRESRTE